MDNRTLAQIFQRIADLLEIKGEMIYKVRAYRNAADSLVDLSEDVNMLYQEQRLQDIPGVGEAISKKIGELLETGKLGFLEKLEGEVPASLLELLAIPEIGPKKVNLFWKQAGITTLAELKEAASAGKLRGLPGMGERSEQRILAGIARVEVGEES
jgi:DNA polymerase (family 10)